MPRLFVALEVPQRPFHDIQNRLDPTTCSITRHIHITLKFLGDVSEEECKRIMALLEGVHHDSFRIEFAKQLGGFPTPQKARVIFVPVEATHLKKLHHQIDSSLSDIFSPESKFVSHVTIARARDHEISVPTFSVDIPSERIERFVLFESKLETGEYKIRKTFKLK